MLWWLEPLNCPQVIKFDTAVVFETYNINKSITISVRTYIMTVCVTKSKFYYANIKLTKNVKLKMHSKYFAIVDPQSTDIIVDGI